MNIDDAIPSILWPLATSIPTLSAGQIHLWCWSLHPLGPVVRDVFQILSADEQFRANRFAFERDRRRYVFAHARVRELLARYLHVPTADIAFSNGAFGKPYIANNTGLQFNLTHSTNLAILAISRDVEIGVDVEFVHGEAFSLPIEQFSSGEQKELCSLSAEALLPGFYVRWTRKESLLKGLGIGLLGQLDSFSVSHSSNRPIVHSCDPLLVPMHDWTVESLVPATGYIGALAIRAVEAPDIRCFHYCS